MRPWKCLARNPTIPHPLLLPPLPIFFAWFRYYFERNAFRAGTRYAYDHHLEVVIDLPRIADNLTGKMYFFAWYSRSNVYRWLRANLLPVP